LVLPATGDEGVKGAVKQRLTVAYFGEMVWGDERWLKPVAETALVFEGFASIRPKE
jgi:hypothetical protein